MGDNVERLKDMLDSDANFRAQFDRSSDQWHGDRNTTPVPAGLVKRIPEEMKAHANWRFLRAPAPTRIAGWVSSPIVAFSSR